MVGTTSDYDVLASMFNRAPRPLTRTSVVGRSTASRTCAACSMAPRPSTRTSAGAWTTTFWALVQATRSENAAKVVLARILLQDTAGGDVVRATCWQVCSIAGGRCAFLARNSLQALINVGWSIEAVQRSTTCGASAFARPW